jgi:hypothetical protein
MIEQRQGMISPNLITRKEKVAKLARSVQCAFALLRRDQAKHERVRGAKTDR